MSILQKLEAREGEFLPGLQKTITLALNGVNNSMYFLYRALKLQTTNLSPFFL